MAAAGSVDASWRESSATRWAEYLTRFHAERPGITERILGRCRSDGTDPYRWCAEPLDDDDGPVLDIACGSAPMATRLTGWIGTDDSAAELTTASARGRGPLLRSSATRCPSRRTQPMRSCAPWRCR